MTKKDMKKLAKAIGIKWYNDFDILVSGGCPHSDFIRYRLAHPKYQSIVDKAFFSVCSVHMPNHGKQVDLLYDLGEAIKKREKRYNRVVNISCWAALLATFYFIYWVFN